jgi:predicted AlkP superfamily pyrophosphatase or phosphodiesterase
MRPWIALFICYLNIKFVCYDAFSFLSPFTSFFQRSELGSTSQPPIVLLISIDGFRPDYMESGCLPQLGYLGNNQIFIPRCSFSNTGLLLCVGRFGSTGSMTPQFPSLTFPNHFSLVTGVYPEVHGIVNNRFFDPKLNETFSYHDAACQKSAKWWNYEPVTRPF